MKIRILRSGRVAFAMCFAVCGVMCGGLYAQATRPAPVTTPTAPNPGRTPTQPSTTQQPNNPINNNDIQRPIYVSGKVLLSDGTPPPESVTMQLICSGSPHAVGYTDSKGRFNIDLGNRNNSAVFADASESGLGRSIPGSQQSRNNSAFGNSSFGIDRSFIGCDLQAYLPGFRSDRVSLSSKHAMDNPEIGTVFLHRIANVEGLTISATSAMAPKDAKKAFDKGFNEAKKSKWENAEREFEKAVESYPKYATAWYELGVAQQRQNNFEAAKKSYAQALAADSKLISPYSQLAYLAAREEKWDEVLTHTNTLVRLNPVDFPQGWYYNALANYRLQKYDDAEKAAKKGLEADSAHSLPKMEQLLAVVLAEKHDYAGAATHLKEYLKLVPQASDAENVRKQLAEIEKANNPQASTKTPE